MQSSIQIGLIGPGGRMGKAFLAYLETAPDINLAAKLERGGDLAQFVASGLDVVVDLSLGQAVETHGPVIVDAGIPYIVGATGYSAATLDALCEASVRSGSPVLIVPNFSLGANLMIRAAAAAAKLMHAPVITERHHTGKADSPSGTAAFTAQRIAEARAEQGAGKDSTAACYSENLAHVMGGALNGVAIHSLRGDGYLAEQAVQFTLPGESLTLEHRSIDRRCFMPGIAYAVRNIGRVRGIQTGLDTILEG